MNGFEPDLGALVAPFSDEETGLRQVVCLETVQEIIAAYERQREAAGFVVVDRKRLEEVIGGYELTIPKKWELGYESIALENVRVLREQSALAAKEGVE